ncbi:MULTISPECIES: hypothetical protein [unclassified Streptomyces]|uniref:hypothetical protein n=1 Tax=unclassified Streptomyces TaxID=2593676 RepID=UPI002E2C163A|nr:hypothetical protein [Streptomyces sp. NBC_01439]
MDVGDWIAVCSGAVAVAAAGISTRRARHASGQVAAAQEQVRVARQQLEHAEAVHREKNEPHVLVDIQPGASGTLVIVVENIGSTIARNVRIEVDPPLESGWGEDLTEALARVFSRTFPVLPPRRRLEFLLDEQERFQNTDLPTAYAFTVRCEGPYGPVEDMEHVVDFGTYAETLILSSPLRRVEDKLDDIGKELATLAALYEKSNASAVRKAEGHRVQMLRAAQEQRRRGQLQHGPEDHHRDGPTGRSSSDRG